MILARVLSVYHRAINLSCGSVVHESLGPGPATLVIPAANWPPPWREGEWVRIDPAEFHRWSPPPPPGRLPPPAALRTAKAGLAGATPGLASDVAAPGVQALAAEDWAEAVRQLAGLGPGLTPSGDDLLCGYAVACHRSGRPGPGSALLAARSTPLSERFLAYAAQGLAGAHHIAWVDAILLGAPISSAQLLAHGATSGADWATGAILALEHLLIREGKRYEAV